MVSLIVAGSTGAVGRTVVQVAISQDAITTVVALTRQRNIDKSNYPQLFGIRADDVHAGKIKPVTVDWESLVQCWQTYKSARITNTLSNLRKDSPHFHEAFGRLGQLFGGHTLAAMCLGSTFHDEGSAEAFARTDYDYVLVFTEALLTFSAPAGGITLQTTTTFTPFSSGAPRPEWPDSAFRYHIGDHAPVLSLSRMLHVRGTRGRTTTGPRGRTRVQRARSYEATEPQAMDGCATERWLQADTADTRYRPMGGAVGAASVSMESTASLLSSDSVHSNQLSRSLDVHRIYDAYHARPGDDTHANHEEDERGGGGGGGGGQESNASAVAPVPPPPPALTLEPPTSQLTHTAAAYASSASLAPPRTTATLRAMGYVSAFNASCKSWILYARTKGCTEAAVEERVSAHNERSTRHCEINTRAHPSASVSSSSLCGFAAAPAQVALTFLRPGLLAREKKSRFMEKLASYFVSALPARQCGLCIVADLLRRSGLRRHERLAATQAGGRAGEQNGSQKSDPKDDGEGEY